MDGTDIKEVVKEKYGQAALRVNSGGSSCCGATAASGLACDPITANLYNDSQAQQIPEEALLASLGCGNPIALAQLNPGEVVLDLGSGGGNDVLLSARRVGPTGKAYGLDMTGEMLALANENQRKAGAENVEFLRGEIEHIPLPDSSVDVIIRTALSICLPIKIGFCGKPSGCSSRAEDSQCRTSSPGARFRPISARAFCFG